MAGLKKLFTVERTLFQANSAESPGPEENAPEEYALPSSGISPVPDLTENSPLPDTRPPRLPHKNHQAFRGIERQFEELHDEIQSSPPRPPSSALYTHIEAKPSPLRTKRHVDVLEAIFSAHRYHISCPVSPTTLYNEDIAERNLRARSSKVNSPECSRVYQEDVADRNMRVNGSKLLSSSQEDLYARAFAKARWHSTIPRSKSYIAYHQGLSDEDNKIALRIIASERDLRKHQYPSIDSHLSAAYKPGSNNENPLRSRNSAPALSVQSADKDRGKLQADQAGKRPKSALYIPPRGKSKQKTHNPTLASGSTKRKDSNTPNISNLEKADSRLLSPNAARVSSKKNVRDLSINTKLAAPRKKFVKVPNQSLDTSVPTPRSQPTASIAEIVNSPLAVSTPSMASPGTGAYNADEMMNLFKQAYKSTHMTSPHPTFETLQEAIIREINSHDAFRQINPDSSAQPSPALCTDVSVDEHSSQVNDDRAVSRSSSRSVLAKDGKRRSRSAGRLSLRKSRRSSDALGRELSFPAIKGLESQLEDESGSNIPKRRHTYAQPPSLDLVRSYENQMPAIDYEKFNSNSTPKKPTDSTPKRMSDIPITKRSYDELGTVNSVRPQSSHSRLSKAVSAIWDSSDSSKRSVRRSPRRDHTSTAKPSSKSKSDGVKGDTLIPPEIHLDHADSDEDTATVPRATGSAPQSPTQSHNITAHNSNPTNTQTNTSTPRRTMYHTSPIAARGRKAPPLKSNLHIDLLEAARAKA